MSIDYSANCASPNLRSRVMAKQNPTLPLSFQPGNENTGIELLLARLGPAVAPLTAELARRR